MIYDFVAEAIKDKLIFMFKESDWDEIKITIGKNSTPLILIPCGYGTNTITEAIDVSNILVNGAKYPHAFGGTLDEVVYQLASFDDIIHRHDEIRYKCRKYFEKHIRNCENKPGYKHNFAYYSGLHENAFGYRPSGPYFDEKGICK